MSRRRWWLRAVLTVIGYAALLTAFLLLVAALFPRFGAAP
jgi:hypothetical protein